MAKAKKTIKPVKKAAKKRADKYEQKLQINGSFEDLVKELIIPSQPNKKA